MSATVVMTTSMDSPRKSRNGVRDIQGDHVQSNLEWEPFEVEEPSDAESARS